MSIYNKMHRAMRNANRKNERYCLLCTERLEETLEDFIEERILCDTCTKEMNAKRRIFRKDGVEWIVLHEYNEFLEKTLFQYKEQRDVALSSIFLKSQKKEFNKWAKKYQIVVLCSSEEKRKFRAFEPLIEWFKAIDVQVYSPLYKTKDWKQSSLSYEKRKGIQDVLQKKQYYTLSKKPILLFDDVITSGATLERAQKLLPTKKIVVFAANKKWLEEMEIYEIKKPISPFMLYHFHFL